MKYASAWPGAFVFVTLIAGLTLATAGDTMYRWVDADGNVVYSDQPPPADARDARSLNERLPISEPDAEAESDAASIAEQEAEFQERRKQRADADAEASKEAENAALRKKNCEQARSDLEIVTNPPRGRLREQNADGELVYMTEEQRQVRIAEAKDAVEQWCNG
jgi:hypothetical protein